MRILAIFLALILALSPALGKTVKPTIEVVRIVKAKKNAISPNVVFVIDGSSTINNSLDMSKKFQKAWDYIASLMASDQFYFCVYVFHDKNKEKYYNWVNAGGLAGKKELAKAKKWILKNTSVYSWGLKAIRLALRKINLLDKNKISRKTLTVVLISDGGLTEAARAISDGSKGWHHYSDINKTIEREQAKRKKKGLGKASIVTIGIENKEHWSLSVKRRDWECQKWLRYLGTQYGGGYYLVRKATRRKK